MKIFLYLTIIIISIHTSTANSQTVMTKHLTYGKLPVGYKVFHKYDNSRSFFSKYDYYGNRTNSSIGRPMQISLWYPAKNVNSSTKMTLNDYIEQSSSEIYFSRKTAEDRTATVSKFIENIDVHKKESIINLLSEKVYGYLNAEELGHDFPIIIYAPPMNTSAFDNYLICEFLSSKGYIVLSVMAKGEYGVLQSRTLRAVNTQAEDLAFLLDFAKNIYTNDKVGVFGFSLGGLANIIFASKNKAIDATVSLDGSVMSQGWLKEVESSEFYSPSEFTSNLLLIGKNLNSPKLNPSTFLDEVKYSDKALIRYDHDQHGYFSGINLLSSMILDDKLSLSEKNKNYAFYGEMTRYVGDFFDQYLKNEDSFKEYKQKGYDHSFNFQKGFRKPIEPKLIGPLIISKGFDYTEEVINATLKNEKDYLTKLDWRDLLSTSNTLRTDGRVDEAIETLLLSNSAFPNWYVTNFNLGKLYIEKGNISLGKKHLLVALKDNPKHIGSIDALKKINVAMTNYHDIKIQDITPYLGKYIVDEDKSRKLYISDKKLFLSSNYWKDPVELWPYSTDMFLVESDDSTSNMQILFQFDDKNNIKSLSIRGLNSGRINAPNLKY